MAVNRLIVGQKKVLSVQFAHFTGTSRPATTWQSSNTGVLTVTARAGGGGEADIEAKAAGTATVTATPSGITPVTWSVTVVANPNSPARAMIVMQ